MKGSIRSSLMACVLVSALTVVGISSRVDAQPVQRSGSPVELSAAAGWGSLWDDETALGRGVALRGGVGYLLAERLLLSGEIDWMGHTRDSGYLAAEGDVIGLFARATYLFRAPSSRVRPTLGAGLGVIRSAGVLTFSSYLPGAGGPPVPGPVETSDWAATHPAFDISGGVRIRAADRVWIRPEVSWRATTGTQRAGGLEPPFIQVRTLVNLDVELP
jgi:hypothetical protein